MDKRLGKYAKLYRKALMKQGFSDVEGRTRRFAARLAELYASPQYSEHNVYPTVNVELIYAVIAMCLELRDHGLSDTEIMAFSDVMFQGRRRLFAKLIGAIDLLPNSFDIARRWNISDHEKRVQDGSIIYDEFDVTPDSITYRISGCRYVDMFEAYGIRGLCKIFCKTDMESYAGLTRHVSFTRHSDLSDGDSCFDEIHRR